MILAFYKVDNSLGYERHTFDNIAKQKEILAMLQKLPDEEVSFYNTDIYSWGTQEIGMETFETDFNDEIFDGGWWCVVIR